MNDLVTKLGYRYLTKHRTQFIVSLSGATIYGIYHIWSYYGPWGMHD